MSGFDRFIQTDMNRWGKTLETVSQDIKTEQQKETETKSLLKSGEVTGLDDGNFEGAKVEIRQSEVSKGYQTLREESTERLGKGPGMGAKALNAIGTTLLFAPAILWQAAKSILGTVVNLVGGAFLKGIDPLTKDSERVKGIEQTARQNLGAVPMENSIVSKKVEILMKDGNVEGEGEMTEVSLEDALETLRTTKLGGDKRVTHDEMMQYVQMGERIMHALSETESPPPPTELKVNGVQGEPHTVKPGVEVTRAISWYLQAKAIVDNSGHEEGAFFVKGAMVAKDPGNKLYDFLRSSNECYGRISSHMKDRTDSFSQNPARNWDQGGFFTMTGAGYSGKPLQYGIEDYETRMPGWGGALLFDKLKPSGNDGEPEIYLKWEQVGMPHIFSGGDNKPSGDCVWHRGLSFFRCIGHTATFLLSKAPSSEQYRGEKLTKGQGKEMLKDFKTYVNSLENVDSKTKAGLIKQVQKYGATEMDRALNMLTHIDNGEISENEKQRGLTLQDKLGTWMGRHGPDMGIERKGAEIHVKLVGDVQPQQQHEDLIVV